ncbi:MAG: HAMP domain-containing histidine kinase [Polyangiaceae bacterium]|nr:HAMP domain-containing histidine kinase [Polyangiaceae bacterium]
MSPSDRVSPDELGRLLALFVHDLRNPLAAISMNAKVLEEVDPADPEAREIVADVQSATVEAERGVAQLGVIAEWLQGAVCPHPDIDPPGDLARALDAAAARAGVVAAIGCPPGIVVRSAKRVSAVVEALLANARDQASSEAIGVVVEVTVDEVRIEVQDGGIALTAEHAALAFALAGQAELRNLPRARYGRCAALFACRLAVESLGGTLAAGGEDGAAFFRVVLPLP